MRRWLAALAVLISLLIPGTARAQAPAAAQTLTTLQSLEVDIWPEYDRAGVLVIYRMSLASTVKLPADLTIRIPATAGEPSAVAEQTANGLFNVQYDNTKRDGDWQLISFTTTLPQIQIEYYDPGLTKDGDKRSFSYHWPGDYPVGDLQIKVQQPRTASAMALEPKTGTSSTASDGLRYFEVPVGKVNGGDTFQLNLSYIKTDDTLTQSAAFEQVTPIAPAEQGGNGQLNLTQIFPWFLGGLGLLLIGGGVFWYLRGTPALKAEPAARRHNRAAAGAAKDNAGGEGVFCHQCGKKSSGADVFCRSCGTKLRR